MNQKANTPKLKERIGSKGIEPVTVLTICWITTAILLRIPQAQSQTSPADAASDAVPALKASNTNIWQNGTGERIKPRTQSISFNADAGYGVGISDGKQSQYLALAGISDGYRPGSVEGEGHCYRGNWGLRGRLSSGAQFSPMDGGPVGLTPHLRYNFSTANCRIPYVDAGAGVSATNAHQLLKEDLATVPGPVPEGPAILTLRAEGPDEIALKRVTLKGPVVALVKSDRPLQTFNPFALARNGDETEDIKRDPLIGHPRGIVLFSIRF